MIYSVSVVFIDYSLANAQNSVGPGDQFAVEPAGRGEGKYSASQGSLTVTLAIVWLDDEQYAAHVTAFTKGGRCVDSWAGVGKWQNTTKAITITSIAYITDKSSPKVIPKDQITLKYNSILNVYSMTENEKVQHGMGCSFKIDKLSSIK